MTRVAEDFDEVYEEYDAKHRRYDHRDGRDEKEYFGFCDGVHKIIATSSLS